MAAKRKPVRRPDVPDQWRNRIVEFGEMTADELQANPRNPRIHGDDQKSAMGAMLTDVGWVAPIVVNRTSGLIVDGHMRAGISARKGPIPVAFVELTEDEERQVMALMDPIGAMATYNEDALSSLVQNLPGTVDLATVLDGYIASATTEAVTEPATVELKPLQRAHVLISIPLDRWDEVADLLDQLGEIEGVDVNSTVN